MYNFFFDALRKSARCKEIEEECWTLAFFMSRGRVLPSFVLLLYALSTIWYSMVLKIFCKFYAVVCIYKCKYDSVKSVNFNLWQT